MSDGFVYIPRDWLTPKVLSDPQMLRMVVYLAKEISDRGSIDISSGQIQIMFGISRQRFREFLKKTKSQPTNNQAATNITFKNQIVDQSKQPSRNQVAAKSRPSRQSKTPQRFTPPTRQEVADYVAEKRLHFDPASFIPFYESKGWKVGNQPMKDWKAACRTWEIRWKEKYGEQFYYQINRPSVSGQADRYARIMEAATTILRQPDNFDAAFHDKGRHT